MKQRKYKLKKHEIIKILYKKQGDTCPLCMQSIHEDMKKWLQWHIQATSGRKKGEKRIKRGSVNINIDHIIPVSKGGGSEIDNLALTHKTCNAIRGNTDVYN